MALVEPSVSSDVSPTSAESYHKSLQFGNFPLEKLAEKQKSRKWYFTFWLGSEDVERRYRNHTWNYTTRRQLKPIVSIVVGSGSLLGFLFVLSAILEYVQEAEILHLVADITCALLAVFSSFLHIYRLKFSQLEEYYRVVSWISFVLYNFCFTVAVLSALLLSEEHVVLNPFTGSYLAIALIIAVADTSIMWAQFLCFLLSIAIEVVALHIAVLIILGYTQPVLLFSSFSVCTVGLIVFFAREYMLRSAFLDVQDLHSVEESMKASSRAHLEFVEKSYPESMKAEILSGGHFWHYSDGCCMMMVEVVGIKELFGSEEIAANEASFDKLRKLYAVFDKIVPGNPFQKYYNRQGQYCVGALTCSRNTRAEMNQIVCGMIQLAEAFVDEVNQFNMQLRLRATTKEEVGYGDVSIRLCIHVGKVEIYNLTSGFPTFYLKGPSVSGLEAMISRSYVNHIFLSEAAHSRVAENVKAQRISHQGENYPEIGRIYPMFMLDSSAGIANYPDNENGAGNRRRLDSVAAIMRQSRSNIPQNVSFEEKELRPHRSISSGFSGASFSAQLAPDANSNMSYFLATQERLYLQFVRGSIALRFIALAISVGYNTLIKLVLIALSGNSSGATLPQIGAALVLRIGTSLGLTILAGVAFVVPRYMLPSIWLCGLAFAAYMLTIIFPGTVLNTIPLAYYFYLVIIASHQIGFRYYVPVVSTLMLYVLMALGTLLWDSENESTHGAIITGLAIIPPCMSSSYFLNAIYRKKIQDSAALFAMLEVAASTYERQRKVIGISLPSYFSTAIEDGDKHLRRTFVRAPLLTIRVRSDLTESASFLLDHLWRSLSMVATDGGFFPAMINDNRMYVIPNDHGSQDEQLELILRLGLSIASFVAPLENLQKFSVHMGISYGNYIYGLVSQCSRGLDVMGDPRWEAESCDRYAPSNAICLPASLLEGLTMEVFDSCDTIPVTEGPAYINVLLRNVEAFSSHHGLRAELLERQAILRKELGNLIKASSHRKVYAVSDIL